MIKQTSSNPLRYVYSKNCVLSGTAKIIIACKAGGNQMCGKTNGWLALDEVTRQGS
jgi:hypothetical protein